MIDYTGCGNCLAAAVERNIKSVKTAKTGLIIIRTSRIVSVLSVAAPVSIATLLIWIIGTVLVDLRVKIFS